MRLLTYAAFFANAAFAQSAANPDQVNRALEQARTALPMHCEFEPLAPILTFSIHYEGGYALRFAHSAAEPRHVSVYGRVTTTRARTRPLYWSSRFEGSENTVTGRLPFSDGDWRIEAVALDENGRACDRTWTVQSNGGLKTPPPPLSPLTRITILLDAAPVHTMSAVFERTDLAMLGGSLASLSERIPAKDVRVVVFNLDREKELFRTEKMQVADIDRILNVIGSTSPGTLDVNDLGRQEDAGVYLSGLIGRELLESSRADAVIFLGPLSRCGTSAGKEQVRPLGAKPAFFYLQLRPVSPLEALGRDEFTRRLPWSSTDRLEQRKSDRYQNNACRGDSRHD